MRFIELHSAYKGAVKPIFSLNIDHIVCIAPYKSENPYYENANCVIEYLGTPEFQTAHVTNTYDEVMALLNSVEDQSLANYRLKAFDDVVNTFTEAMSRLHPK